MGSRLANFVCCSRMRLLSGTFSACSTEKAVGESFPFVLFCVRLLGSALFFRRGKLYSKPFPRQQGSVSYFPRATRIGALHCFHVVRSARSSLEGRASAICGSPCTFR